MKALASGLAYSAIFIPVVIGSIAGLGFEQTKVLSFIVLTGLATLLSINQIKSYLTRQTSILSLSLIFLFMLLLSTTFSINPSLSFFGQSPYYQGCVIYLCLWLSYLVWRSIKVNQRQLLIVLALSCSYVTLLALQQFIQLNFLNYQILNYAGRVISTFGQPNFFAGFLVLCLPLFLFATKQSRQLGLAMAPINLFGIVLSESRSALAIAVVIIVIWLTYLLRARLRRLLWGISLATIFISLIGSHILMSGLVWQELDYPPRPLYFLHDFPVRGFYFWQFTQSYHPEKRFYIWPVIGELALDRPILGYGLETLSTTFPTAKLAHYHGLKALGVDSAHNYLFDLWYSGGVFVLSSWVGLFILAFRTLRGGWRWSLLAYLLLVLAQNQSVVHLAFFWLMLGLADRSDSEGV